MKNKYYARNPGEELGSGITRDQTRSQSFRK